MLKFGSKGDSNVVFKCTVRLLEDTEILECEYKPNQKGKHLLEYVCQQLNIAEQDYFGLRYVDSSQQRHWLDLGKSITKQVKDMQEVLFSFRVKFYPPDPFKLKEEITRYQIFMQLKRDLLHGRLCSPNESIMLAALIIQGELGDYDPEVHVGNYVSSFRILLKQTEQNEEKIMEIHKRDLKGQSPSQVENKFLKIASQLDTYGVDPHPAKDHKGTQLYLGINYSGILTFQGSRKTHHFRWPDIQKINYEGKMFIIHLNYNEKKHTIGFKCATGASCKYVWRCAIEQMLFFTLPCSSDAPPVVIGGGFFSWGTKFKYTGRTEREILEDANPLERKEPKVQRTSSISRKAASVPATPSTPLQPHLGYNTVPCSSHSDGGGFMAEPSSNLGLYVTLDGSSTHSCGDVAGLQTVSEDHESSALKNSLEQFSEYNFRDSFDHSSSESQLHESSNYRSLDSSYSHRCNYNQALQFHPRTGSHMLLSNIIQTNSTESTSSQKHKQKKLKKRIILLAIIFSVFLCSAFLILSGIGLQVLNNLDSLSVFKCNLYELFKQQFQHLFSNFFKY
ncbi:FERM domain-containing protein 5-like isoform X2 [Agrilus planipennis]|uniref:Moesin/ezrin/radixin homolog 1 n=1 Tax=Agrilus planipennis TaxID=224129 RepID=A0A1W4XG86_AGRPL|nr:FERM domain-containing protein 5-like isoform X2 [Agrilus planipennis]